VVVHVVRDRAPAAPAHARRVRGRSHAELQALRPHRVVVVLAVDAEGVQALARARPPVRNPLRGRRGRGADGPVDEAGDHHRLEAQLADGVLELVERLGGRVHRDLCHRSHALRVGEVDLRVEGVEGAAGDAAHLVVADRQRGESPAGVEDGEVEAQGVEPLVEEPRQVRGGAVEGGGRRKAPPGRPGGPELAASRLGQRAPRPQHHVVEVHAARGLEARGQVAAAGVLDEVEEEGSEHRERLDHVAVRVDHRMVETRAHALGPAGPGPRGAHARSPSARRATASSSWW
jgi:hypothetical protein